MPERRRAVDPALLPHERPCWCADCKAAYGAAYYQARAERWRRVYEPTAYRKRLEGESTRIHYHECQATRCSVVWISRQEQARRYCTEACKASERWLKKNPATEKTCVWCFRTFIVGGGTRARSHKRHCSEVCRQAQKAHTDIHHHPVLCHLPFCIDCHRPTALPPQYRRCNVCTVANRNKPRPASNAKKSAARRRRDAMRHGDLFTVHDLIERDGPMCAYPGCGQDVDMTEHHLNARYGTIDHIVPVSAGGEHTMANCVVMHRGCNAKKGIKVVEPVQLRIV